jgi:dipeptidyl aminopeptidase/acylaminoacyl peptidase
VGLSAPLPSLSTALRPEGGRAVRTLSIDAPGARLHAWLVTPAAPPPWPLVVMAHGWAAVKEMNLDYFAAAICDEGIAALVFDHRGFGGSDGVRGDIDPAQQIDDYRTALGVAERMDGVDPGRLGVWGTSFSGGHVICLAAGDDRVRAAVAQVPTISGGAVSRRRRDAAALRVLEEEFARERTSLAAGGVPRHVPAAEVGDTSDLRAEPAVPSPVAPAELPFAPDGGYADADRGRFYAELPAQRRRTWRNRITLLSLERYASYEPGELLSASSAPLLVITAEDDTVTPTDLTRDAIARAGRAVETLSVPGGHYAVYTDQREHCARAAAAFLARHIG